MNVTWNILEGDVRERLRDLPAESVHCVMTSPPYYALRDYGTAVWEGGDPDCEHQGREKPRNDTTGAGTGHGRFSGTRGTQAAKTYTEPVRGNCPCGARRIDNQLGLEATPDDYVANMVEAFREVWRVLRPDGTVWLNMGDSYSAASTHAGRDKAGIHSHGEASAKALRGRDRRFHDDLKPKDLVGIPWMVAFALRADGWWLRTDIIWAKKNCLPESVQDRPTRSHEFIFLLTKSARYFYDAFAVREPEAMKPQRRITPREDNPDAKVHGQPLHRRPEGGTGGGMRNQRDVWFIRTRPFPEAHFAVFPPELVEPCVKAGSSERGCCAECGAPITRIVEHSPMVVREGPGRAGLMGASTSATARTACTGTMLSPPTSRTTGWQPSCECPTALVVPCTVLDPFAGSGTTLLVANRLGRNGVGVELSPEYAAMARRRLGGDMPLFATEAP